jgi:hypothetical protein
MPIGEYLPTVFPFIAVGLFDIYFLANEKKNINHHNDTRHYGIQHNDAQQKRAYMWHSVYVTFSNNDNRHNNDLSL